jgi:toxin FitB
LNYLLDTCVLSELVKPHPNQNVLEWLSNVPNEQLFLSVITIAEIRKGLTKLQESRKKQALTNWLNTLLDDYQTRIYEINLNVAENWGVMQGLAEKAGTPIASLDSFIAAVAYTYHLVLVTRNEKDFLPCNVPILNPWK